MMIPDVLVQRASRLLQSCAEKSLLIVTAESCTGGLIAGALTAVSGSSRVVDRGWVTYSNAAKSELLGVPVALIETDGAVSEAVARAMAEGALMHAPDAHISVAVTGIAGPGGGSAAKPVGLVHVAAARRWSDGTLRVAHRACLFGDLGRDGVRMATVEEAFAMIEGLVALDH